MIKTKKIETKKEELVRRLTEYEEYSEATRNFHNLAFYKELREYIQKND